MNRPTFEGIVAEHLTFIRQTLSYLGVQLRDLDDVVQGVLQAVNRGLPAFDLSRAAKPEGAVTGWVFSICDRKAANYHRKQRQRREVFRDDDELDGFDSPSLGAEECLVLREQIGLLYEILMCLDPERRAVIVAYELEETPMVTVAVHLGIPVNTAWNRLRLARRDILAAWHREAEKGLDVPVISQPHLKETVRA